jgi:thioredoxin-related protein
MKRLVIISILVITSIMEAYAQKDSAQGQGIVFLQNTTWQEVLNRAKSENKYIFVDCYTSWCGPCKWMDKNVYADDSVGRFMNGKFLSVRLQMDTAKLKDNQDVVNWYATAHDMGVQYKIDVYPTYLFFTPDGQIAHEETSTLETNDFLQLAGTALNPHKQYYTLLARYQQGEKDYADMPYLISMARRLQQNKEAQLICDDYVHHYLEPLPYDRRWTKENLEFMASYAKLLHSDDQLFQSYYRQRGQINSIMARPGYSDRVINAVLYNEEITPGIEWAMKGHPEPDWKAIRKRMEKKYNSDYAEKNVLTGRVELYKKQKRWDDYIRYFIRKHEKTSLVSIDKGEIDSATAADFLNDFSWEIFKYGKDRKQLKKGISWVNRAMSLRPMPMPRMMDTKANILYKMGRKKDAIALEQQSYGLASKDKDIQQCYEKMKKGVPTWPSLEDDKKKP